MTDSRDLYEKLKANGNFYGTQFEAISKLKVYNQKDAIAQVVMPNVASTMPLKFKRFNVIHPTTLDALMHSSLPLYTYQNGPGSIMPISIEEFTISSNFASRPREQVFGSATVASKGPRVAKADILGFNAEGTSGPGLIIWGMELRSLGDKTQDHALALNIPSISYPMEWGPDSDYIRLPDANSFLSEGLDEPQLNKVGNPEQRSFSVHTPYHRSVWRRRSGHR